jgi:hypothetical protein
MVHDCFAPRKNSASNLRARKLARRTSWKVETATYEVVGLETEKAQCRWRPSNGQETLATRVVNGNQASM